MENTILSNSSYYWLFFCLFVLGVFFQLRTCSLIWLVGCTYVLFNTRSNYLSSLHKRIVQGFVICYRFFSIWLRDTFQKNQQNVQTGFIKRSHDHVFSIRKLTDHPWKQFCKFFKQGEQSMNRYWYSYTDSVVLILHVLNV